MPRISDIHSIIIPAQNANLTAHTYTEIIGGLNGCEMIVNGVYLNVAAQSNIPLWIRSISGGTGCSLAGENSNMFNPKSSIY